MKIMNNLLILLMWIINIISIILNITINYEVNILISIALSIVIILPRLLKNKFQITDTMEFIFLIFVLLAGEFGSILKFYDIIYWYDSFTHFLSGALTGYMGLIILSKTKILDKNKFFSILFIISLILAVAAAWEIFEFTSDSLLGYDAQRVLETGVSDTMKDIICALLGGITFIALYLFKKNAKNNVH